MWNKNDTEYLTSRALLIGVWISATLMILGLLIGILWPSSIISFSANPSIGTLFIRIFSGHLDPVTLMFVGLVLLMCTPVLRVMTAIFGFAMEKEMRFVLISSVVLIMLIGEIIYSILIK